MPTSQLQPKKRFSFKFHMFAVLVDFLKIHFFDAHFLLSTFCSAMILLGTGVHGVSWYTRIDITRDGGAVPLQKKIEIF